MSSIYFGIGYFMKVWMASICFEYITNRDFTISFFNKCFVSCLGILKKVSNALRNPKWMMSNILSLIITGANTKRSIIN